MDEYDESLSKFILQLFNLVVNSIGMALIGIGAYKQAEHYLSADNGYTITPFLFIIVGVVILMTACESESILQLFQRVFIIIGMAVICIGYYVKMKAELYLVFANNGSPYLFKLKLGVMICYAGSAMMIVFWVCEGACKEMFMHVSTSTRAYSRTSTRTFKLHISAIVIIILLVEFGVGIFGYVLYIFPQVSLQNDMENGLVNYSAWAMDRVQRDFECCGITNYTDWAGVGSFTEGQTPDSCCKFRFLRVKKMGCGLDTDAATKYTQGCLMEFQEHIGHVLSIIGVMGGVVMSIFIIKLIGICVAWRWLSYQLAFKEIQVHKFGKQFFKITEI